MFNCNANGVRANVSNHLFARTPLALRLNGKSHFKPRQAYAVLLAHASQGRNS